MPRPPQAVMGQVRRPGFRVREHVAGDALNAVVVQCQVAKAPGQEGGHVHQLVVGQVEGLQLPGVQ